MSIQLLPHPICWFRTIARSLRCVAWVSGHDYREVNEGQPNNVTLLKCDTCGAYQTGWDDTPEVERMEGQEILGEQAACIAALEAELARLREAALPFAAMERSSFMHVDEGEHYAIVLCGPGTPDKDFTGQDIERLRNALKEGQ